MLVPALHQLLPPVSGSPRADGTAINLGDREDARRGAAQENFLGVKDLFGLNTPVDPRDFPIFGEPSQRSKADAREDIFLTWSDKAFIFTIKKNARG